MAEEVQNNPSKIIDILDEKEVSRGPQGSAVWRLVELEDSDRESYTEWRPFQLDAEGKVKAEPVWQPLPGSQTLFLQCPIYEALYSGSRGPGKRLSAREKVLTDSGWVEAGEVTRGDRLVAPDGTFTEVRGIYPSDNSEMYRLTFGDGSTVEADREHLWRVYDEKAGCYKGWETVTTGEVIRRNTRVQYIPLMDAPAPGVRPWDHILDPYILGLLLGDGTMGHASHPTVYTPDEYIILYLVEAGWHYYDPGKTAKMLQACNERANRGALREFFDGMGKGRYKYVPEDILLADPETRLAALQGLMDSDGSVDTGGRCTFTSVSTGLAEGVQYLVRSLGGSCSKTWDDRTGQTGGLNKEGELPSRWRVRIQHRNKFNPFRLPRKSDRVKWMGNQERHRIDSIEYVGDVPAVCFEVAHPSRLFVVNDFVVTHNTLTLLMDFAKEVDKGYGQAWRGILFRRHYGDLDDIVKKIDEWFPAIFPGFRFLRSKSDYMGLWPNGEALLLRHMKDGDDYSNHHGHEYCLPYGDVWTENGWKPIQDIEEGERVYSRSPRSGEIVLRRVTDTYAMRHVGQIASEYTRGGQAIGEQGGPKRPSKEMTPGHRLPILDDNGKSGTEFTLKPQDALSPYEDKYCTLNGGYWAGERPPTHILVEGASPELITLEQYLELVLWIMSQGCIEPENGLIAIGDYPKRVVPRIQAFLDDCGFDWFHESGATIIRSQAWADDLARDMGAGSQSMIPQWLLQCDTETLQWLWSRLYTGKSPYIKTRRLELADQYAEIAMKLGWAVVYYVGKGPVKHHTEYRISIKKPKGTLFNNSGQSTFQYRPFAGWVYCLSVEDTETFFVRQNGHVWLSGNSWIGWEELCEWEDDEAYRLMMSCSRPSKPNVPCRVRATTNPFGPGRRWVKSRFQLPQKMNQVIQPAGEMPRVAIHGDLSDNFLLLHTAPNYPMTVRQAASNPAQAEAWITGSWSISSGGMFDDLFEERYHVLPDFPAEIIPRGWRIDRSYDHGQSSPFSVLWWLESNGEPIYIGNHVIGGVRGDVILFAEWYGTTGNTNEGVRLPARDIAEGILDREDDMGLSGRVDIGPADTEIFNQAVDRDSRSPAMDMEDVGITWERANKSPGSRKRGWEMMRTLFRDAIPESDGTRSRPGLFTCARNTWWIELVPTAPRDSKDMDELPSKYEDHACDSTRYRIMHEPPVASSRKF